MTGGEPLMHKDTYKVLDYALKYKNKKLQMGITSNFSPADDKLIDKFIDKLFNLERVKSLKHFMLFVSLDSIGKKAEYIRSGMDWGKIKTNIDPPKAPNSGLLSNIFNLETLFNVSS